MNPFKFDLVPYTRGVGLEISADSDKTFPHFIKVTKEELRLFRQYSLDFAVLHSEDSKEIEEAFPKMWELLKPGKYMNLVCPKDTRIDVVSMTKGWTRKELITNSSFMYVALKKVEDNKQHVENPVTGPTCAVVRYGGIGDMMMTSIVFPELKKQGYHVTLYTHGNSYECVKHNPHIDRFVIQDSGQVPAHEFRDFMLHLSKKYTKFINLSESIEGTLLSLPDRVSYYWPTKFRHLLMNKCCYEVTAGISEVPVSYTEGFYRTPEETLKAKKYRRKLGEGPVILFVLSGSSTHKIYPHQDTVIARILLQHPTATIVLVGDSASQLLEQGWENEPRVVRTCGKWGVRETMSFCFEVDIIITPETGVGLSVQFENIPKILLLSHSSVENYSSKWVNCYPLHTDDCECYPCHQLHYGYEYCNIDEDSHCAMCQVTLNPDKITEVVNKILN